MQQRILTQQSWPHTSTSKHQDYLLPSKGVSIWDESFLPDTLLALSFTRSHRIKRTTLVLVHLAAAKSLQLCLTPCNPMDCSPQGSSVHETSLEISRIFQARILEWVATPSSEDVPYPGIEPVCPTAPALQADSLPVSHVGSPWITLLSTYCRETSA